MAYYLTKSMLANLDKAGYPASTFNDTKRRNDSGDHWKRWMSTENKESLNFVKDMICRVCAKNGCTPLMDKLEGDFDIMSAIISITNVTISSEDPLPKYICTECLMTLKVAYTFKKNCEASDKKFKRLLSDRGNNVLNSYPYSKHDFSLILHQMKQKRLRLEEEQMKVRVKLERARNKKRFTGPKEKLFKCSPCDLTFKDKETLLEHRRERQCARRACDVCGQLVASISQHRRLAHPAAAGYKCAVCGKEFPVVARLNTHMLVHTDTFKFFCDLCPYKSKHKYYLVMHMRTHTGEKPYRCALCAAAFVNPSNLNKHRLTHTDKQFKCSLCEKAFRTNSALREHTDAAHMNIKHACNLCGRDFCYKSDLRKHEIRMHNRAKRDYVGGEPSYRQVERLRRQLGHEEQMKNAACEGGAGDTAGAGAGAAGAPGGGAGGAGGAGEAPGLAYSEVIYYAEVPAQHTTNILQQAVHMMSDIQEVRRLPNATKEEHKIYEPQQQGIGFF